MFVENDLRLLFLFAVTVLCCFDCARATHVTKLLSILLRMARSQNTRHKRRKARTVLCEGKHNEK